MSEKKQVNIDNENITDSSDTINFLQKEIEDLKGKLLLSVADSENLRKRMEKEKEDIAKYSISAFSKDILPVRDSLLLALKNSGVENSISQGIKLTLSELDRIFEKNGITIIDSMGKIFDPHLHQVMFEIVDNEKEPGTIIEIIQEGFTINNRLLRPALVGTSKKEEKNEAQAL